MIYIEEKPNTFIGGRTSLYITFDFNQDIIDIIKGCNVYYFSKRGKFWEVPLNNLSYLLDNLVYIDSINLKLFDNKNKEVILPCLEYKTKPFDYQLEAIKYGLNHNKWLLLDEMGLGKTKTLINLAEELRAQKHIKHCLVICGIASLKTNWKKEIEKHSNLSCRILGERVSKKGKVHWASLKERAAELDQPLEEFFIITNIETLRTANKNKNKITNDVISNILNGPNKFDMIILDEAHKCSGANSQQTKGLLQLDATYKVAATGTPIINSPLDLYVPLTWINVNNSAFTNYKYTFCIMDDKIEGKVKSFKNVDLLKDALSYCSLRRTKSMLPNLPSKTIIDEYIDMDDKQLKFVNQIEEGVKDESLKVELKPNNILAMITRIRQALISPSLLTTEEITSSKLDRCVELVQQFIANNEKVVIFSNYKEPVYKLKELLKQYKPLIGTGDIKDDIISQNIDKFQNNDDYKLFIGTISKMGTGITLNKATNCIFIDLPLTAALYNQACDRIHRVNNDHPVFIYNLIYSNSLDEYVHSLITKKQATSDYVIDDKISNENNFNILKKYIENI